jgi:hypothetical protein
MSCAVLQLIRGQDPGCSRSGGGQEAQEGQQHGLFFMLCDFLFYVLGGSSMFFQVPNGSS